MKKATLIVICIFLTASIFAQEGTKTSDKPKYKISAYHAIGSDIAVGFTDIPIEYTGRHVVNSGVRLHILNGMQFNPWLILAFDVQLAYNHYYEYYSYVETPMKGQDYRGPFENVGVKLGVDFRYRILNKPKWSPILGVALGPSLEMFTYPQREKKQPNDWWFGGYCTTYFGISYRFDNGKILWFGVGPSVEYLKDYTGFFNGKFEIQF